MTRTISRRGEEFIARWEAVILYVYDDKAPLHHGKPPEWDGGPARGTLTVGIGHTDAAKDPLKCTKGLRITREQAFDILGVDLADVGQHINQMVKVPVTQGQFDALMSLTYNMGEGNLRKSSLLRKLNAGDYRGARACFDLYTKSKGQHMDGLQRRRDAEQLLWDEQDAPHASATIPAEDDFVETPKTDEAPKPKPLSQSTIIQGTAATATALTPPAAGAVIKAAATAPDGVDTAAPTVTERVTEIVDHAGNVLDTVRTVHDSAPELPPGTMARLAHVLTDPVVWALCIALAFAGLGFVIWRRHRQRVEEGV